MKAGSINTRIMIQKYDAVTTSTGQTKKEWKNFASVWANVYFGSGREFITGGQDINTGSVSIRIRYRKDIRPNMRVLLHDDPLNIVAVRPDMVGKEHVDLVCEKGANNG